MPVTRRDIERLGRGNFVMPFDTPWADPLMFDSVILVEYFTMDALGRDKARHVASDVVRDTGKCGFLSAEDVQQKVTPAYNGLLSGIAEAFDGQERRVCPCR